MAGDPLLDGFAFGAITADYVPVPPGDYDIRVVPEATGTTAINVEGLTLSAAGVLLPRRSLIQLPAWFV